MKKSFLFIGIPIAIILTAFSARVWSQANTTLSNLVSPTSVNQSLFPSSDNTKDFGSTTLSWKNGYFDGSAYVLTTLFAGGSSGTNALQLNPNSTGKTSDIRFMEVATNGTNYVGFRAPTSIAANKVWVLPDADGSNGQVLSTNGTGTLSWITPSGGGVVLPANAVPRSDGAALIAGTLTDNGSKIGLGTGSPGAFLHINVDASPDIPHLMIKEVETDQYARIYLNSYTGVLGDERKWKILGRTSVTEANNDFYIQQVWNSGGTNFTSTRFYIKNNGDIGMGTSLPAAALHVVTGLGDGLVIGPETGTPDFIVDALGRGGFNVSDPNAMLHVNAESGDDALRVQVGGLTKLFVNSNGGVSVGGSSTPPSGGLYVNGNTGIGTSSPSVKLHVNGSDEVLRLDGTNPYMQFFSSSAAKSYIQSTGNDFKLGTVGTNTLGKVQFTAGSSTVMTLTSSGRVGVGTTSPSSTFHVKVNGEAMRVEGTDAYIQFYSGTTAKSFIQRVGNDFKLGTSTGNTSGDLILTTSGGSVWLLDDGRMSIGTSAAGTGYKLSVAGKVICEELKVELMPFPDYVFDESYDLASLDEVESYIKANKRLPGFPAASEVEENMGVGELQRKMMEKIEELTLYVIDLQKQNNALKEKVTALEVK